jgi:hypothetical protein
MHQTTAVNLMWFDASGDCAPKGAVYTWWIGERRLGRSSRSLDADLAEI